MLLRVFPVDKLLCIGATRGLPRGVQSARTDASTCMSSESYSSYAEARLRPSPEPPSDSSFVHKLCVSILSHKVPAPGSSIYAFFTAG